MGIIKDNLDNNHSNFIGSINDYAKSDIVIIGAPMDYTASFKPGSRFAPQKIRELSWELETYSPYLDRDLQDKKYFDYGDLEFPFGNVSKSLEIIGKATKELLHDHKIPIFLGGEHLISLPIIKEMVSFYENDVVILHFDAHTDLRETYIEESNSHATVMRHVSKFINSKNIYQFGIRSGLKEEFKWAKKYTNLFFAEVVQPLESILNKIEKKNIYITIDIDVLDPAFAPGTGTPESGGITSKELLRAIHALKDFNIIGMDLVEVLPLCDVGDITSVTACKVIRECILSFL
ncbi:agmatinase [Garciella nitratireducens]|uniref:Agmatinase n=1 Tax=Garciella nitratireducens DSM 15102 TaxID=1121911 RepID=A0A1T4JUW4_9FIRM|nr:agmatinase [Garciella nitratireducens]RBP45586.1 agmatinase [Garciella nitratireducens]SJZ33909.1 agmatinase [Garciella nitratireducens DSM 15102]